MSGLLIFAAAALGALLPGLILVAVVELADRIRERWQRRAS